MNMNEIFNCPICGSSDYLIISNKMKQGPQLQTAICKSCSLVFSLPKPSLADYNYFYENEYSKYYGSFTAQFNSNYKPPYFNYLIEKYQTSKMSYLEIGPGKGQSLYYASQIFNHSVGVEPSKDYFDFLSTKLNLNVIRNTGEEFLAETNKQFDVIGCFHLLEHVYNPLDFLEKCHFTLNENGLILIEVPNIYKPFKDFENYFLRYVHLYNFSPTSLTYLLNLAKFEVVSIDTGSGDWRIPNNIFIIARKSMKSVKINQPEPYEYQNVLSSIRLYKRQYLINLRFKHFVYNNYINLKTWVVSLLLKLIKIK
jgi:SAM-dependent methyltransferase